VRWVSWRTVVAVAALLGALVAATAAGYLQLTTGVKPVLQPDPNMRRWAVVAITCVAVVTALSKFIQTVRMTKHEVQGRKVASALRGLNKAVAKVVEDEKTTDKFGASAYLLRGLGPVRWLHRIERERVADLPLPSSITWRPGKGVIGTSVLTEIRQ